MREEKRKKGTIIVKTPSMVLKWLKHVPGNKKLNIIGLDNKELRNLAVEDYNLPGDIMQLYLPTLPKKNAKKGRFRYVARQLARMINKDTDDVTNIFRKYTAIIFFAVGECGLVAVNIPEYLEENRTIRIVTVATPFFGTGMADEKFVKSKIGFLKRVKDYDNILSYLKNRKEYVKEYGKITRNYHFPDEELVGHSTILYKTDDEILKRHLWFNFISSDGEISEFAKKVFEEMENDGIVPVDSQDPESENVNRTIYISASHEEALLKTIEYFNKAISDKALLQPIVDFKG